MIFEAGFTRCIIFTVRFIDFQHSKLRYLKQAECEIPLLLETLHAAPALELRTLSGLYDLPFYELTRCVWNSERTLMLRQKSH